MTTDQYHRSIPRKPRIVIEVSGGNVANVYASHDCDVIIVDHDIIESSPVIWANVDAIVPDGDFRHLFAGQDRHTQEIHDELKELQKQLDNEA
jgi:hypothetical protein